MFEYIWILLPLGLIIGWYAAKIDSSRKRKLHQYLNLRYYLEKDKTAESISLNQDNSIPLNIEDEGIEFTLTLGDAYRRRGEVDKAIELHEHLLSTLDINDRNRYKVLISLAEDYSIAGIFDRTENTLRELLPTDLHDHAALKLAQLYKQQNDWLQAVAMYERITNYRDKHAIEVAHLYCELAEQSISEQDFHQATFWANQALDVNTNMPRVSLIKTYIALHHHQHTKVIAQLNHLSAQQSSLILLVVPIAYRAMMIENQTLFQQWLDEQIQKLPKFFYLKLWKTHYLIMNESLQDGIQYLTNALMEDKNLQGITLLNQLKLLTQDQNQEIFELYHQTFHQVIDYYAQFRCEKCGFISKNLQWHCPSCQSWNTAAPVSDIIALQK